MNVSSVSSYSAAATQSTASSSSTSTLNYDAFLRLLLEQLKNQDPTEPMKSTDYMAQMATFSQVEQTVKSNAKLDALLASSTLNQASGVIGKTVTSSDGTVKGTVSSVLITNDGAVANLANGKQVLLGPGVVIS